MMRPKQRSPATKFDDIPGSLPIASVPEDVNISEIATSVVSKLDSLSTADLVPNAIWRDYLAVTGTLRTLYSPSTIITAFNDIRKIGPLSNFKATQFGCRVTRPASESSWIDIGFTFSTGGDLPGAASGIVSVVPNNDKPGEWSIWMLRTWLEHFEGHGDPDELQPVQRSNNEPNSRSDAPAETNDSPRRDSHVNGSVEFGTVVVGAGQCGLSVAGRLEALGVSYLLVERNADVGDNWTKRYDSLRWHTSKNSCTLPFGPTYLPDDDTMLTTKMIASGFKRWTRKFDINIRLGTVVQHATWNENDGRWTITLLSSKGQEVVVAQNLVLAIGGQAETPVSPSWPGREKFKGTAVHSADYKSSRSWSGKAGIVVGTANTAHDVAEDMVLADFNQVTMVQRGKTFVFPAEWLHHAEHATYNNDRTVDAADRLAFTYPNKITREMVNAAVSRLVDASAERFDALERAGFKLDRKGDIYDNLYCRFGGHYVDIGTSDRIAKGQIQMKSNSLVKEWTEDGLRFEDGSEIKADLVVLCTGFSPNYRKVAAKIVGEDVADAMDDFFGLDPEGEIRGVYKPAGHPRLYYIGYGVREARWFSRFIALQIQADVLGKPLVPYTKTP